ncbi:MAG: hypothetical protein ABSF33_18285 [Acidimicrobiales bacterium]|jgi:phospholipase C
MALTARWCPIRSRPIWTAPTLTPGRSTPHTNTQLYNILSEENRFKLGEDIKAPWNAPKPGQKPTMDGYVTDYISAFTAEMGRL